MSRPRPTILIEYTEPKTYKTEQVLKASAIYAVYYEDQPINLRSLNKLVDYPGPKYRKSSFSNPGHAFNLQEKLNKMFKTDKFRVVILQKDREITEEEYKNMGDQDS